MKILFLTVGKFAPSSRYRVHQFKDKLLIKGNIVDVISADEGNTKFVRICRKIIALLKSNRYDLVYVQKPNYILSTGVLWKFLINIPTRLIFDFDDAIFIDPKADNYRTEKMLNKINEIMKRSISVITGNEYLAGYAKNYNAKVHVVPTVIDTAKYYRFKENKSCTLTIGWMGTKQNVKELLSIKDVLLKILSSTDSRLIIVSNMNSDVLNEAFGSNAKVEYNRWLPEKEVEYLNEFDIGLMPLADNLYNRGKCGFKLIQYMAVEIPTVASPVGVNKDIVIEGITGYIANSEPEWYSAINKLIGDKMMRKSMGRKGRRRVVDYYSVDAIFPQLYSVLIRATES